MRDKKASGLIRFELPEDLHSRLLALGYRQVATDEIALLKGCRLYKMERGGVYHFAAFDEQRRPLPLLAIGQYFRHHTDLDRAANAELEQNALKLVIGDLQRIASKRSHPTRWEQLLARQRFAIGIAVGVALVAGLIMVVDRVSSQMEIFGFVKSMMARKEGFDEEKAGSVIVWMRLLFVLATTAIAYWIAAFVNAWRHPVRSVELSKKSLSYHYGPEAARFIEQLEKETGRVTTAGRADTAAVSKAGPEPAGWHGYGNFVSYEEIERRLQLESKRANRFEEPLSCLIMTFEPDPAPDRVPVEDIEARVRLKCPQIIWHSIREIDSFARYGDNGFIIVMPNTDEQGARIVEDRLKTDLAACDIGGCVLADVAKVRTGVSSVLGSRKPPDKTGYADGEQLVRQAESSLLKHRSSSPRSRRNMEDEG